ncbi:hypothetical protein B0H63DRAFT_540907, partial [Podospora didyma]
PASNLLVHRLIHDRARLHPDNEALHSLNLALSYGELDSLSSRLACRLAKEGIKPEGVVPLFIEKSVWAVVAMLAVMKAGGAFMPLDVSQPESRIQSIIRESGSKIALASADGFRRCSSLVENTIAVTEETMSAMQHEELSVDSWHAIFNNAAYVMATSGSTGSPKLVVTEHSQMSSFMAYFTELLGFTDTTRTFQFASYAFDPIIGDIFLTLAAGGTVCIPSEDERKADVVGTMRRMRVTLAKFTPSLVGSLSDLTLGPDGVPSLKTLVLGGESATADIIKTWAGKVNLRLIYGATECTMSFVKIVDDTVTLPVIPGEIGLPVGCRAFVVYPNNGQKLQHVERGEVGELVVEGPLVSRGYTNNQAQTDAKFIITSELFHRQYRTGDLVRELDNGNFVYIGRVDNQVKIRGQRLELEEVERNLQTTLSTVSNVVVKSVVVDAAVPLGSSSKQLVAFLSLKSSDPLGSLICDDHARATVNLSSKTQKSLANLISVLETSMRSTVPSYMIPTLWVPIDEMPYTLSRKRDRQKLRRAIESLSTSQLVAFSRDANTNVSTEWTEKEALLRRIWSEILAVDSLSIQPTDNFFYLGGNSLLALRLVSKVRVESQQLSVDTVFSHPVLRDLTTKLEGITQSTTSSLAPFALLDSSEKVTIHQETAQQCAVQASDIEDILPLYSMQHHYITGYPEQGRPLVGPWNWQQQIVFLVPKTFDIPLFKSIWDCAVARHAQLRTRVVQTSCGIYQTVLRHGAAVPAMWSSDEELLDDYAQRDQADTMSFGDPLLRLAICKSTDQSTYFVVTMQHLIYDAYSRDLLFKELERMYRQPSRTLTSTASPSYGEFIRYSNRPDDDREQAIAFWTSYLSGASTKPLLSLPARNKIGDLQTHKFVLPRSHVCQNKDYTLATMIEVSAALAVSHFLGHCLDVIFYSDRSGRNSPVSDILELVAPTTLFLPLRVHIDHNQTVEDLLRQHQAGNAAMMPHEFINWTELREMEHLRPVLGDSINININPYTPLAKLGKGMGLKVETRRLSGVCISMTTLLTKSG